MSFRNIFRRYAQSWQHHRQSHIMTMLAVVDYHELVASYHAEKKERAGHLELKEHLRRDAWTSVYQGEESRLKAHEELEALLRASKWE